MKYDNNQDSRLLLRTLFLFKYKISAASIVVFA